MAEEESVDIRTGFTFVNDNEEHSSMDSFVAVSNDKGEDSYTIIDHNLLQSENISDSLSSSGASSQPTESHSDSDCDKNEQSNDDNVTNPPSQNILSSLHGSHLPAPQHDKKLLPDNFKSSPTNSIKVETAAQPSFAEETGSMSQSVIVNEEYISQTRARSLQKVNKDLLIKNKKLSGLLSEEKQKSEMEIKLKKEENDILHALVNSTQEQVTNLKELLTANNERTNALEITLQSKNESLAARDEEVDYLSAENATLKRNSADDRLVIKTLRDEIEKLKRKYESDELQRFEQRSRQPLPVGRSHHHSSSSRGTHHSSSSSSSSHYTHKKREGDRRDQIVLPPSTTNDDDSRRRSRLKETVPPNMGYSNSKAFESLSCKTSALTRCPICGEERPDENAMDMTRHVEECLAQQGYT